MCPSLALNMLQDAAATLCTVADARLCCRLQDLVVDRTEVAAVQCLELTRHNTDWCLHCARSVVLKVLQVLES